MLAQREQVFREPRHRLLAQLRALHAAGRLPELAAADVVLLIDGFGALRTTSTSWTTRSPTSSQRGGGYGIHVVAACSLERPTDADPAAVRHPVELRLNDPADSSIDRRLQEVAARGQSGPGADPAASCSARSRSRGWMVSPTTRS